MTENLSDQCPLHTTAKTVLPNLTEEYQMSTMGTVSGKPISATTSENMDYLFFTEVFL